MANPVPESTEQEREKQPPSHEKIKAKLIRWISYIAGDMTAFGEWMKGRIVHAKCVLIILVHVLTLPYKHYIKSAHPTEITKHAHVFILHQICLFS